MYAMRGEERLVSENSKVALIFGSIIGLCVLGAFAIPYIEAFLYGR